MDEPENYSPKPFFHDTAYHTNMNEMDELALALNAYWEQGMDSPTPLRFALPAGQPVYMIRGVEYVQVSEHEAALPVSLDPARRGVFPVEEMLLVGSTALDTFLMRLDFAVLPSFDTIIYNRLRLDHLLPCLEQSYSPHARPLWALWQLCRHRWLLHLRGRKPFPLPCAPYRYFGLPPSRQPP